MENYLILLELPFDLPESDTNKISEAISKKQAQWSRDQSNPVKKAKASEYLAALEDIKKVMLDPTARKQEAAKAKQIKASKAKELEAKLTSYWRPLEGTDPYIGKAGEISCEPEIKAEVTVFKEKVDETIEAIKKVHPYEEPVINVIPIWRTSF